jgi:hypothetical protein
MKTKLIATILLTVIGLLLVLGSTSYAQPLDDRQPIQQQTISNTVYLPLIVKPCLAKASAYMTASDPLIHVGDTLTVTGAIVNECARQMNKPSLIVEVQSTGILTPSIVGYYTFDSLGNGQYRTFTVTLQAVSPGEVTLEGAVIFEDINDYNPPMEYWDVAHAQPIVVRVMPNLP